MTTREIGHERITLPLPQTADGTSLAAALAQRRSLRRFADRPIDLAELGQLLWAAQGISDPRGHRTAPSAGALYPLECYVAAIRVAALPAGIYHYDPVRHDLGPVRLGDCRAELVEAALWQDWIAGAAVVLALTAVTQRTTGKYGDRGLGYVRMEAGHAAQNVCLQAQAMELGSTPVGAFRDAAVVGLLQLSAAEVPIYLLPVGHPG